jgi:uncharacterized membrane protein
MAKSPTKKPPPPRGAARRDRPAGADWFVVLIALAGAAVSGYLGIVKLAGGSALMCQAGGDCDIVQASRYGTILGLPTALWGTAFYVAVGVLGALGLPTRRWLWTFLLAAAGAAFSLYLTAVSLFVIEAACPYCLASTAIAVALVGVLLWRRPPDAGRRSPVRWSRLAILGGVTAAVTVVAAAAIFAAYPGGRSGYQAGLARHLARTNAVMYGAYWCPACKEQKARFGAAANEVPYVECDPRGIGARPDVCASLSVRSYPTWVIGGQRREGVLTLEELAQMSGFTGSEAGKPQS